MKGNSFIPRWIFWGILPIAVLAMGLYHLSNHTQLAYLQAFILVRPSLWEHLKLLFWPQLLWWSLGFLLHPKSKKRKEQIPSRYLFAMSHGIWVSACAFALILSFLGTPIWALPVAWSLACILGQWIGHRIFVTRRPSPTAVFLSMLLVLSLGIALAYWTHQPPELPVFTQYIG